MDTSSGYAIKGLRTWKGRQGVGCSGKLVLDKVEVASFHDDANGGAMCIEPRDRPAFNAWLSWVGKQSLMWPGEAGKREPVTFEREAFVINALVDAELERRQLARWCKTDLLFRLQGDREGHYRRVPIPRGRTAEQGVAFVRAHYQGRVVEVANERFMKPAKPARKQGASAGA